MRKGIASGQWARKGGSAFLGIIESLHGVNRPRPCRVPIRVGEHITTVVQDYVQDHANVCLMRILHEHAQIFRSSEVRINIQEILHAIAVVRGLKAYLLENGSYPNCCDTHATQISQLAGYTFEVAPDPDAARIPPPLCVRNGLDC